MMIKEMISENIGGLRELLNLSYLDEVKKEDKVSYRFLLSGIDAENARRTAFFGGVAAVYGLLMLIIRFVVSSSEQSFFAAAIGLTGLTLVGVITFFLLTGELSRKRVDERLVKGITYGFWIGFAVFSMVNIYFELSRGVLSEMYFLSILAISAIPIKNRTETGILLLLYLIFPSAFTFVFGISLTKILFYLIMAIVCYFISALFLVSYSKSFIGERETEISRERAKLAADNDNATGALNMKGFTAMVKQYFYGDFDEITAIIVDIDKMRDYNIRNGYDAGTSAVYQICNSIRIIAKAKSGVMARADGDSFIIAYDDISEYDAVAVAEQLRVSIELLKIKFDSDSFLTASVGVARLKRQGGTVSKLITEAERSLMVAKTVRNCVGYKGRCFKSNKE